ncbi:MAG TPA: hypothetical protein VK762_04695 [Polyangiaceae bacterium]|nr:hypothetical protein [Polyangiaceae bacterium]
MRRVTKGIVVLGVVVLRAAVAHADIPIAPAAGPTPASSAPAAPAPAAPLASPPPTAAAATPTPSRTGLAVVALAGAADAAWPLARSVYDDPSLRPTSVDEAHARVLCGAPAPASAEAELRDLSETVAAVHGDDAPSRSLLDGIARRFGVRALVVVGSDAGHATARLYLAETGAFDAAAYAPDEPPAGPTPSWSGTTRSLDRLFGTPPGPPPPPRGSLAAPTLATREAPKNETPAPGKPFYESGWFWGALGAAAVLGGAAYLATRDSSPSTIHLEVQVPH